MGALLDGGAVRDDDDEVGIADGREAVGDDDGGASGAEPGEGGLDGGLAFGVEGGGRFIEEQDARVA